MDNKEKFARQTLGWNKDTLLRIRKLLRNINECDTEFALSHADEYRKLIDLDNIRAMIKTVQERIDFINLSTKSLDTLGILNNEAVVKILYEFIKTKIMVLDLSKIACTKEEQDDFVNSVTRLQEEIKRNQIRNDIKIFELEQLLNDIFAKLQISNLADLSELTDELKEAIDKAKKINDENERLAKIYEGHFAFAKAYNDAVMEKLADKTDIEEFLKLVYEQIKDRIDDDTLLVQGRKEFVDNIKENITLTMLQNGLFKKLKDVYSDILSSLYTDIQLYK